MPGVHLYTWMEKSKVRVKWLAQKHNTVSLAIAWARTAWSGGKRTSHEATTHPTQNRCSQQKGPLTSFSSQMRLLLQAQLVHTSQHYFTFWTSLKSSITQTSLALTLTAMPFRSDEAEAAVGEVLGTVFVLVSLIRILDTGISKHLDATYKSEIEPCYHCNSGILLTI